MLSAAVLRGTRAKRRLLSAGGGAWDARTVAEILATSDGEVETRRRGGGLLAVEREGVYAYPAWQFAGGHVLPGLPAVLVELGDLDPWMQLDFFLNPHVALAGADVTPLEALRGGATDAVLRAARLHGGHGAA